MKKREAHIATSPIRLTCPQCFAPTDAATSISGAARAPVLYPGAIVICAYCATINIVTPEMKLRRANAFERRDILQNDELATFVQACLAAHNAIKGGHVH